MEDIDNIIFYLNFAKSKLDTKYLGHKKAREEIDEIINMLKEDKFIQDNEKYFS